MKEKWQLAIFAAAVSLVAPAATFRVAAPDGSAVCTVTPPDYGPGAVLETTNLTGCVAWRVRFTGTGERTIEREEWTFAFGEDFRCWPVSHAQGEYIPKTLSTIATMKPMPWREIPCAFDETRFLQGKIGEYAVVARRVGEKWFVGGLNGLARRNFSIPLDFVGEGDLDVRIFMDADPALKEGLGKVAVSARRMKSGDVFSVDAAARGGFALIVEKAKTGQ